MKNKKITITISGQVGTGKSILSLLLIDFLRSEGFMIKYEGGIDHNNEASLRELILDNFDEIIKAIKQNSDIIINEIQERYSV